MGDERNITRGYQRTPNIVTIHADSHLAYERVVYLAGHHDKKVFQAFPYVIHLAKHTLNGKIYRYIEKITEYNIKTGVIETLLTR